MTLRPRLLALALLLSPLPLLAADAPAKYRSAQEILDASPASDWHSPAPENLLYMELDAGRVIIELAPQFAPEHAELSLVSMLTRTVALRAATNAKNATSVGMRSPSAGTCAVHGLP